MSDKTIERIGQAVTFTMLAVACTVLVYRDCTRTRPPPCYPGERLPPDFHPMECPEPLDD